MKDKLSEIWDTVKVKVKVEWDRQAKEVMGEMYREKILTKDYSGSDLSQYFKDWKEFERDFFDRFLNI
jgi:hypothetical protein